MRTRTITLGRNAHTTGLVRGVRPTLWIEPWILFVSVSPGWEPAWDAPIRASSSDKIMKSIYPDMAQTQQRKVRLHAFLPTPSQDAALSRKGFTKDQLGKWAEHSGVGYELASVGSAIAA